MAFSKEMAELFLTLAQKMEVKRQMLSIPFGLPNLAGYEKARQEGQLAFFKAMGVKCRPLKRAESVRHKGKAYILSTTHSKEEALEISKRVHEALRRCRGVRFTNGVRVQ